MSEHKHTVELPEAKAKIQLFFVDPDRNAPIYDLFRCDIAIKPEGIYLKHYDEYRNPTVANFYPHHMIQRVDQDYISEEDTDSFDDWFARAHNGMSPSEEEDMRKVTFLNETAQRLGIDPDDIRWM